MFNIKNREIIPGNKKSKTSGSLDDCFYQLSKSARLQEVKLYAKPLFQKCSMTSDKPSVNKEIERSIANLCSNDKGNSNCQLVMLMASKLRFNPTINILDCVALHSPKRNKCFEGSANIRL